MRRSKVFINYSDTSSMSDHHKSYKMSNVTDRFKFESLSDHDRFILDHKKSLFLACLADNCLYVLKKQKDAVIVEKYNVRLDYKSPSMKYPVEEMMQTLKVDSVTYEKLLNPLVKKDKPFWKFW